MKDCRIQTYSSRRPESRFSFPIRKVIFLLGFIILIFCFLLPSYSSANPWNGKVILQGFWWDYWNNNYPNNWATYLAKLAPRLRDMGIDAVWIPPTIKNENATGSNGYSPFDHYDLGDKYQKGSTPTRFGTRDEYLRSVAILHANGMDVIQDVVYNHLSGAETTDPQAPYNQWKNFRYVSYETPVTVDYCSRTGRFPKNWPNFHPNVVHPWGPNGECDDWTCDWWGPDICYYEGGYGQSSNCTGYNPTQSANYTRNEMRNWSVWMKKQTGVDGFRIDAVKHFPHWALGDFLWHMAYDAGWASGGSQMIAFGEYVGGKADIDAWVDNVNSAAGADIVGSMDFSLRYAIYDMVIGGGFYDVGSLPNAQQNRRSRTIPFVNTHDTFRPILDPSGNYIGWDTANELTPHIEPTDPRIQAAYAVIMAVDGSPLVWFEDLFDIGTTGKRWTHDPTSSTDLPVRDWLVNLIWCHQKLNFKDGAYKVRWQAQDLLIIERSGQAIIGVNDNWSSGQSATVQTDFGANVELHDYSGANSSNIWTDSQGRATIWVPPCDGSNLRRGYCVWGPAGISGGFNPTSRSTAQEWEMANDLGDSHSNSLQQGGQLPANSRELRTAGNIWGEIGENIEVNVYPLDVNQPYTLELYSHTGTPLMFQNATGISTLNFIPAVQNWLTIKVRNRDDTTSGQKVYVKATYRGPQVLDTTQPAHSSPTILVNLKAFLEGPFDVQGDTMRTDLKDLNLLPLSQPYNRAPWHYYVNESVGSIPADVVDWVLIELRTRNEGAGWYATRTGFIKKDGSVVDLDGTSPVSFQAPVGDYFVALRHRNHLDIVTATTIRLSESPGMVYDFSSDMNLAYSGGDDPMKQLKTGIFGMFAGDGNADGLVDSGDRNSVWLPQNGTVWDYHKYSDFNLDGGIDAIDYNQFWLPNNGNASQVP
ncbi:MAG: hypothetical protein Kow0042_24160 [Calditrichia bacterium]